MHTLRAWLVQRRLGLMALGLGLAFLGFRIHTAQAALSDLPAGYGWLKSIAGQWSWLRPWSALDAALSALNGQWDPGAATLMKSTAEALLLALLCWLFGRAAFAGHGAPLGRRRLLALLACGLAGIGLWQLFKAPHDPEALLHPGRRAAVVRSFLDQHDNGALARGLSLDERGAAEAAALLSDSCVISRLPSISRPPLGAGAEVLRGFERRSADTVASLDPGTEPFPVWTQMAETEESLYTGGEVTSLLPLLRLRIAGVLDDRNQIYLLGKSGREERPLQERIETRGRWRQITLRNPGEPFRLVVKAGGLRALSFSDPVEWGRAGWLAGKLLPLTAVLGWLGLALALFSAWLTLEAQTRASQARHQQPQEAAQEGINTGAERSALPWLALVLWLFLLAFHVDPYAGGSDSSGYMNIAKHLLEGQVSLPIPKPQMAGLEDMNPERFVPLGYIARGEGTMVPTYPPGLALMIAGFGLMMPLAWASGLCSLLHLAAMILVTRELARCLGLTEGWAWMAGWMAGMSPMTVFIGLQPMSDLPAAVWTTAALILAWRSRGRATLALGAGAALGLAVLLRPTNVVLFVPVLLLLLAGPLVWPVLLRRLALFACGGLPLGAFLAAYNFSLHGNPLATGYGNPAGLFSTEWLGITLAHYAHWVPLLLGPLVVLALVFPFVRSVPLLLRTSLSVWILLLGGLYAIYSCTHETWWYHRFVLPIFPVLVVASLVALRAMTRKLEQTWRGTRPVLASVFAASICFLCWQGEELWWMDTAEGNRYYEEAVRWVEDREPGALVAGLQVSGALVHYTKLNFVDARDPKDTPRVLEAARRSGRPLYAVVLDFEREFLERPGEGSWVKVHSVSWIGIYRWDRH